MTVVKRWLRGAMAFAIAASVVAPLSATTLVRASLDEMVAGNKSVVVGEVVDSRSYWNADHSFILTDVELAVADVAKGARRDNLTVTIMGGRVGDITTLIIAGPELIPGKSYVLFLNEEQLPGGRALTVRDLAQGTFEVKLGKEGDLRAVSQANAHALLPDAFGSFKAAGGAEGFPLTSMVQSIRDIERHQGGRKEAK